MAEEVPAFNINLKIWTPSPRNVRTNPTSFHFTLSDLVSTTFRIMAGKPNMGLELSPQSTIDLRLKKLAIINYIWDIGLYRLDQVPVIPVPRDPKQVDKERVPSLKNYRAKMMYCDTKIAGVAKKVLLDHFRACRSNPVPAAGQFFADPEADDEDSDFDSDWEEGEPVCLIVGIDTRSGNPDEHCVRIKNMDGSGFTTAEFEEFQGLWIPYCIQSDEMFGGSVRYLHSSI